MERDDTNLELDEDNVKYDPLLKPREYDATSVDTDLEYEGEESPRDRAGADFEFEACIEEAVVDSTDFDLTLAGSDGDDSRTVERGLVDFDFGPGIVVGPPAPNPVTPGGITKPIQVVESPRENILASYRLSPDCVVSLLVEGSADREAVETLLQRLQADVDRGVFDSE